MMRLEAIIVQEVLEEVTDQESEPSLKVGDEDHPLGGFRCRHSFAGRQPACYADWDTSGGGYLGYVGQGHLRPLPARTSLSLGRVILFGAEVAVILEEAIEMAGTGRESWSPVLLVLAEAE
jgi:hypothetical protein